MVSVIYDHRAWPIYWEFLEKKGSSNFDEQTAVLGKSLGLLSNYRVVVLGDREFCSPKLGNWLSLEGAYFCLRQKSNTLVCHDTEMERELKDYGLKPGVKLFIKDCQVTKQKGFGRFNIAGKWKGKYQGFKTKEPWYILTNFDDLDTAIVAYQRRFSIEEAMQRGLGKAARSWGFPP